MYIVKNLKDYNLSHKQRIFAGYLKDNVDSYVCLEKVTNRQAMRRYFAPDNEFYEYSPSTIPLHLVINSFIFKSCWNILSILYTGSFISSVKKIKSLSGIKF